MGLTNNLGRRSDRRRQRPSLECLDERCLLSTTAGLEPIHHRPKAPDHRTRETAIHVRAMARHSHSHHVARPIATAVAQPAPPTVGVERPAGAIVTGAATAYDPIIGAAQTRSTYNVDGTGMTVAVIDTGVDFNNPALGGGYGPGAKVITGYDFADGTPNPMATASQHGTAIAGLIGSSNPNDLGVAPGVNLVALRVTNGANSASLTNIASALQWVVDNHQQYHITAVNMSLADGGNYAQNWFANDGGEGQAITNLIGKLSQLNIPVIAATGNSFTGQQGEGFAAIVAGTISVTATDLSGNLLPDAQRLGSAIGGAYATTIAAPGQGLTAPTGDSGTSTVAGTSFATALVTGGVVLLQDIYSARFGSLPTVAQLKSWIQQGATPIHDPVTGITLGELNLVKSAALIPPAPAPAPPPATPPPTVTIPTPVTTSPAGSTSTIQLFVNGQPLTSSNAPIALPELTQASFQVLLKAMDSWAAGTAGTWGQGATSVQIWNA